MEEQSYQKESDWGKNDGKEGRDINIFHEETGYRLQFMNKKQRFACNRYEEIVL